jgi:hypothetical protein
LKDTPKSYELINIDEILTYLDLDRNNTTKIDQLVWNNLPMRLLNFVENHEPGVELEVYVSVRTGNPNRTNNEGSVSGKLPLTLPVKRPAGKTNFFQPTYLNIIPKQATAEAAVITTFYDGHTVELSPEKSYVENSMDCSQARQNYGIITIPKVPAGKHVRITVTASSKVAHDITVQLSHTADKKQLYPNRFNGVDKASGEKSAVLVFKDEGAVRVGFETVYIGIPDRCTVTYTAQLNIF